MLPMTIITRYLRVRPRDVWHNNTSVYKVTSVDTDISCAHCSLSRGAIGTSQKRAKGDEANADETGALGRSALVRKIQK